MSQTFSILINGLQADANIDQSSAKLSQLFKISAGQCRIILERPRFMVKRGQDQKNAERYREALTRCGCQVILEAESDSHPVATAGTQSSQKAPAETYDFPVQGYYCPAFGISFNLPPAWLNHSKNGYFILSAPETTIQLIVRQINLSAHENQADAARRYHEQNLANYPDMPHLRAHKPGYAMKGKNWEGVCAEYEGTNPQIGQTCYYFFLHINANGRVIALQLSGLRQDFADLIPIYRTLLEQFTQLHPLSKE